MLQRSSSTPPELHAVQPTASSSQSGSQQSCSPRSAGLPRVPSAPAGLGQNLVEVQKNWLQKSEPLPQAISTESQAKPEKVEIGSSDIHTIQPEETGVSMTTDDDDDDDDDNINPKGLSNFKKFARACDSVAPSMIEKFRASSGHSLDINEMEELFGQAGTPQAPETPRQVGESQGADTMF